jgi:hypothetical protein
MHTYVYIIHTYILLDYMRCSYTTVGTYSMCMRQSHVTMSAYTNKYTPYTYIHTKYIHVRTQKIHTHHTYTP